MGRLRAGGLGPAPLLSVRFLTVQRVAMVVVVGGLLLCLLWSLAFDYDLVIATHCRVHNWLPSLSAVTGNATPQRFLWRFSVALFALFEQGQALLVYAHFQRTLTTKPDNFHLIAPLASLAHFVEKLSLLTVALVGSSENYDVHEAAFLAFLASAVIGQVCKVNLIAMSPSPEARQSVRVKWRWMLSNWTAIGLVVYLFRRHTTYCEPNVYSWFALAEYATVLTNVGFHYSFSSRELGHLVFHIGAGAED